jgi:hypothetical protein
VAELVVDPPISRCETDLSISLLSFRLGRVRLTNSFLKVNILEIMLTCISRSNTSMAVCCSSSASIKEEDDDGSSVKEVEEAAAVEAELSTSWIRGVALELVWSLRREVSIERSLEMCLSREDAYSIYICKCVNIIQFSLISCTIFFFCIRIYCVYRCKTVFKKRKKEKEKMMMMMMVKIILLKKERKKKDLFLEIVCHLVQS